MNRFAAGRMRRIEQSGIRRMLEKAMALERSGREVIHMEIGRTDFDTPAVVKEAAKRALDEGFVHYTSSMGMLELRQAIAKKLWEENGIEVNPEKEVLVTAGASEAVMITVLTVLEPGDEILIPEPMYLFYLDLGEYAGARTVPLPLSPAEGFQITREKLERRLTGKTKAILLNSPHNPTGHVLSLQSLQAVAEIARERDLLVISDEIYEKIIYEPHRHDSIASLPGMKERTVTINSFSKSHAMDGWRIGYLAAPADLVWELEKGQQHFIINPTVFRPGRGHRGPEARRCPDPAHGRRIFPETPPDDGDGGRLSAFFLFPSPGGFLFLAPSRVEKNGGVGRWSIFFSKKTAWRSPPGKSSAPPAKAISASPTPIRRRTCGKA